MTTNPTDIVIPNEDRTSILIRRPPPEFYVGLGLIAVHGAAVEQQLGEIRGQLARFGSNVEAKPDDPIAHHRGTLGVLLAVAMLEAERAASPDSDTSVLQDARTFLESVQLMLDVRNQFLHSQWWWFTDVEEGTEKLICRRIPRGKGARPVEWIVAGPADLLTTGERLGTLDHHARFLLTRLMTVADRAEGIPDESGPMRAEIDVGHMTEEERVDLLARLRAGRPPKGLEILGPVGDIHVSSDDDG